MSRRDVFHVSDFIPDENDATYCALDGAAKADYARQNARAQLDARLRIIATEALAETGPRVPDIVDYVHQITRDDWRDDPARALTDIEALVAPWERAADLIRTRELERGELTEWEINDAVARRGVHLFYWRARGLYAMYHAALVRMRLIAPVGQPLEGALTA